MPDSSCEHEVCNAPGYSGPPPACILRYRRHSTCFKPVSLHGPALATMKHSRSSCTAGPAPAVRPALGAQGTVRIDSKLDAGFFCTVSVGGQEFRGDCPKTLKTLKYRQPP
jgi:hypothetical protein